MVDQGSIILLPRRKYSAQGREFKKKKKKRERKKKKRKEKKKREEGKSGLCLPFRIDGGCSGLGDLLLHPRSCCQACGTSS